MARNTGLAIAIAIWSVAQVRTATSIQLGIPLVANSDKCKLEWPRRPLAVAPLALGLGGSAGRPRKSLAVAGKLARRPVRANQMARAEFTPAIAGAAGGDARLGLFDRRPDERRARPLGPNWMAKGDFVTISCQTSARRAISLNSQKHADKQINERSAATWTIDGHTTNDLGAVGQAGRLADEPSRPLGG